jgi:hypothetical protein
LASIFCRSASDEGGGSIGASPESQGTRTSDKVTACVLPRLGRTINRSASSRILQTGIEAPKWLLEAESTRSAVADNREDSGCLSIVDGNIE